MKSSSLNELLYMLYFWHNVAVYAWSPRSPVRKLWDWPVDARSQCLWHGNTLAVNNGPVQGFLCSIMIVYVHPTPSWCNVYHELSVCIMHLVGVPLGFCQTRVFPDKINTVDSMVTRYTTTELSERERQWSAFSGAGWCSAVLWCSLPKSGTDQHIACLYHIHKMSNNTTFGINYHVTETWNHYFDQCLKWLKLGVQLLLPLLLYHFKLN